MRRCLFIALFVYKREIALEQAEAHLRVCDANCRFKVLAPVELLDGIAGSCTSSRWHLLSFHRPMLGLQQFKNPLPHKTIVEPILIEKTPVWHTNTMRDRRNSTLIEFFFRLCFFLTAACCSLFSYSLALQWWAGSWWTKDLGSLARATPRSSSPSVRTTPWWRRAT